MNLFQIGILIFGVQVLSACNQIEEATTNSDAATTNAANEKISLCDCEGIEIELQKTRAKFKKLYPTPDNVEKIKPIWAEAEKNYLLSAEKGVTALVEIIDKNENVMHGRDVFIISNGVKQLREYRGKSVTVTFDQRVCNNHENVSESIDEALVGNFVVEYLPRKGSGFAWICETDEDLVDYGLRQIDFDYVIESSISSVVFNSKPAREIKLVVASDFITSPFEQYSVVKLVLGESDSLPRTLWVKDVYGQDIVEVAQWIYDYDSTESFIAIPEDQIEPEVAN
jgi:hypothetical protein